MTLVTIWYLTLVKKYNNLKILFPKFYIKVLFLLKTKRKKKSMQNISLNYGGTQIKILVFKYWAHSKKSRMIFLLR